MTKDTEPLTTTDLADERDPQIQSFKYQLDFLKLEFNSINESIKHLDGLTQSVKNWTISLWAGSVSLAMSQERFRRYIILTALLPLLFWFVDARWRQTERGFIFRLRKISDFLNGPLLVQSFQQRKLIGFELIDPRGTKYKDSEEFEEFTRILRILQFKTVATIYLSLAGLSLMLWLLFLFIIS